MMKSITDRRAFIKAFDTKFNAVKNAHPALDTFLKEFPSRTNIYIIGGFLRSVNDRRHKTNDLDIIVSSSDNILQKAVRTSFRRVKHNRIGGFKIKSRRLIIDIWNLKHHYGFKRQVGKTELESIAKSCFYNFDSIVFNVKTKKFCVRYYNRCLRTSTLDLVTKI